MESTFWMVWCPSRGNPTYKHTTKSSAVEEAKRLARENCGEMFVVLESMCYVIVDDLKIVNHEHEIPF